MTQAQPDRQVVPKDEMRLALGPGQSPSNDYAPLLSAFDGHFDKQRDKLPAPLRERVQRDFPMSWDNASADLRRGLAVEIDALNVSREEQDQQWRDAFRREKHTLEKEIARWESAETPTASDLFIKEKRLAELQQTLAPMEDQLARGDYPEPEGEDRRARPTERLNHDPDLQARANQIAIKRKADTKRFPTKHAVARILAKEIGMDASTVERRLRKAW